jgi:hypothetical protein
MKKTSNNHRNYLDKRRTEKRAYSLIPRILLNVGVGFLTVGCMQTSVADIIVTERTSSAELNGFVGAGGAVLQHNHDASSTALSGGFVFADSFNLLVTESMPFSTGGASASGALTISDSLVQASPDSLVFTGIRTASSSVAHVNGNGVATAALKQEMKVRFQVVGQAVQYQLTGFYDPGATFGRVGEASLVQLYRPFTAVSAFNFSELGPVNLSGTLNPGFTYEFRLRLNDSLGAGSTNPFNSDSSSFNLQFSVTSVPEASSAVLCGMAALGCLPKRRKKRLGP